MSVLEDLGAHAVVAWGSELVEALELCLADVVAARPDMVRILARRSNSSRLMSRSVCQKPMNPP